MVVRYKDGINELLNETRRKQRRTQEENPKERSKKLERETECAERGRPLFMHLRLAGWRHSILIMAAISARRSRAHVAIDIRHSLA